MPGKVECLVTLLQPARPVSLKTKTATGTEDRITDLLKVLLCRGFDSLRCNRRSRVKSGPALALQPDFGPGMGIVLTQLKVVFIGVPFPALVTGHYPGGNTGRTQQKHTGTGKVFAVAASGFKQELIDAVAPQRARRQGVLERAVEMLHQLADEGLGALTALLPLFGQGTAARIPLRRQLQIMLPLLLRQQRLQLIAPYRLKSVLVATLYRLRTHQCPVGRHALSLRRCQRQIQRQQPGHATGLHHNLIGHWLGVGEEFFVTQRCTLIRRGLTPAAAIKLTQDRKSTRLNSS